MKKLLLIIQALIIYPFLALPAYAQAINLCQGSSPISTVICNLAGTDTGRTIQNIVVVIVILAIVIALLYLLYGGIKWITSRGDKTEVEAARNHITAAIIGLIVVFLAIFIVSIVAAIFGIDIKSITIPKINE